MILSVIAKIISGVSCPCQTFFPLDGWEISVVILVFLVRDFMRIEPCWTKCPTRYELSAGHQQKSAGHVRHILRSLQNYTTGNDLFSFSNNLNQRQQIRVPRIMTHLTGLTNVRVDGQLLILSNCDCNWYQTWFYNLRYKRNVRHSGLFGKCRANNFCMQFVTKSNTGFLLQ